MTAKIKLFHAFVLFCLIVAVNTSIVFPLQSSETDSKIVDLYGQLRVKGSQIVNQQGDPVALRGMSLFWSQWIGKYYHYDCIKWLRDDWKCTVIRAAMGIESDGYLTNPVLEMNKIKTVIDACIDLGIYVIVDWHDHHAHEHVAEAKSFFKQIATLYGNTPNIIYEIYNEPLQVSWLTVIKPYSETVINEIRAIDSDNLIIVGTPTWSQDVDVAASYPLAFENIAYALHFYAATHKLSLRNKAAKALNKGMALFVSEFGTCESTGTGIIDYSELAKWLEFMDQYKLSWCNWSIADKNETSAALKSGASITGNWSSFDLTESGSLIRQKIISWNEPILTPVDNLNQLKGHLNLDTIQNYPNPFNSTTCFQFSIATPQRVRIEIFNILGEKITSLLGTNMQPGTHHILFRSDDIPSGTYFYKFQTEEVSRLGGMQLVK